MARAKSGILSQTKKRKLQEFFIQYAKLDFHIAAMELIYVTGMRPIEFQRLQVEDLLVEEGKINIWFKTKQGEARTPPVNKFILRNLVEMCNKAGLAPQDQIFWASGTKSHQYFTDIINRKWVKIRMRLWPNDQALSLYSFRHTKAKEVFDKSKDNIYAVKMCLGHKDIKSTMHYMKGIEYERYIESFEADNYRNIVNPYK